jgi:hypothetical protein
MTVEELRAKLFGIINPQTIVSDGQVVHIETDYPTTELMDSLITVATEGGRSQGWAATQLLWDRMEEWQKEWAAERPGERELTLLDAMDLIEWRLAKVRAEGAEAERERIRKASIHYNKGEWFREDGYTDLTSQYAWKPFWFVGDAVLAPDTKEKP